MAGSWFELNTADQSEALEIGSDQMGRPAHLLERDTKSVRIDYHLAVNGKIQLITRW